MLYGVAAIPCLPLLATHTLGAHKVGVGARYARWVHWLMYVYRKMSLCSLGDGHIIVVYHLAAVVQSVGYHAHISGLYRAHALSFVVVIGVAHLCLVVLHVGVCLVVADEHNASLACVVGNMVDVEVGIWLCVVEPLAPAPANIPALDKHATEAILCGKVDISAYVLRCCAVGHVAAHIPCRLLKVHLPPYADILHRLNPRRLLQLARLVEVENHCRLHQCACTITHDNHAPWCGKWQSVVALNLAYGCEVRDEGVALGIVAKAHSGVFP